MFAAFIWHAGVVQDAMACASFLKHNTTLTKRGSGSQSTQSKNMANEKSTRESKAKQRHSVEVISTAYLNYKELELMEYSSGQYHNSWNLLQGNVGCLFFYIFKSMFLLTFPHLNALF